MTGASPAPAEQRLDDCRADRHDEHRFDEKAEPGELHELATGGRALHLTLRIQRRVPLLAIELAHQPAGRKGLRCIGLRRFLVVGAAGLAGYFKREMR